MNFLLIIGLILLLVVVAIIISRLSKNQERKTEELARGELQKTLIAAKKLLLPHEVGTEHVEPPEKTPEEIKKLTKMVRSLCVGEDREMSCVDEKCVTVKGIDLKHKLAEGGFGSVYDACMEDSCNYVIKMQSIKRPSRKTIFNNEVSFNARFNAKGIGPKMIARWECEGMGFMIMEKWDTDLWKYGRKYGRGALTKDENKEFLDKLRDQIRTIHNEGYVHLDIRPVNIFLKLDKLDSSKIKDVTIADFGLMERKKDMEKIMEDPEYDRLVKEWNEETEKIEKLMASRIEIEDRIKNATSDDDKKSLETELHENLESRNYHEKIRERIENELKAHVKNTKIPFNHFYEFYKRIVGFRIPLRERLKKDVTQWDWIFIREK